MSVPASQSTVSVRLNIFEEDTGTCGGDDDLVLGLDVTVDNATGRVSGGVNTPAGSHFLTGERCATGTDGFGVCWHAEPSGAPRLCSSWNAEFLDAGSSPGFSGVEDFAGGTGVQQLPASFARAGYILTSRGSTFTWIGTLDKEGCVPQEVVPPAAFWRTGNGLTVRFALGTEHCMDPTGSDCLPDGSGVPRGARFRTFRKNDGVPSLLCTAWTENADFSDPACAKVVNAFPGWQSGAPPNPIRLVNESHFETTRLSAVVSQMLRVEADGPGIGIRETMIDGINGTRVNDGLIDVRANDVCCLRGGSCSVPECLRDGSCDTCASGAAFIRPDDQPPEGALVPGDSFWKYVVAHEIGHLIQARGTGSYAYTYDPAATGTFRAPPKCACDHVQTSNTLHCLQSVEEPGAAQVEGYAQFFASRIFNRASDPDCTFKYYKEFLNDGCMPGVPADGCQPSNGLVKSVRPV